MKAYGMLNVGAAKVREEGTRPDRVAAEGGAQRR